MEVADPGLSADQKARLKQRSQDMARDPSQTKLAMQRASQNGLAETEYTQFMYLSNEAEADYQKNVALVEANFGASAKKKSMMSGRPGAKSSGGASLYNQTGTGLYTI